MTRWTDKCRAFLLDIVFPNRCPFCNGFIMWNAYACHQCADRLTDANSLICHKCGYQKCTCNEGHSYDMAFASFFFHDEGVRDAIYRFKHTGDTNIAELASENIAGYMEKENISKPDIIVPVPMEKIKQTRRGHNQAELFAGCIGKLLNVPVKSKILFKNKTGNDEQHDLSRDERMENVKDMFFSGNADLTGKIVMLCDDVLTTGATTDKCAELLKELGAVKVITAVCAVTERKNTSEEEGT